MRFFNLAAPMLSLLFGLLAWVFPVLGKEKRSVIASFLCCALSLCGVVLYIWTEARAGDFAAIEDTACGFVIAAIVMVTGTLLSCAVHLLRNRRKEA